MKRKHILMLLALITVFALFVTACGSDDAEETTASTQAGTESRVLGLVSWNMSATTWSSPNGATISLTAIPTSYTEGQTAAFVVRLEGEDIANIACDWDGSSYTADAELNAADGYCYYVVLTAADGTQTEVAVNVPTDPTDEALINMESSLNSYCDLMVEEASFDDGTLTITKGYIQVQPPRITNAGQAITCSKAVLILSLNGEELDRQELVLTEPDEAGLYTLDIANASFTIPALEDDQQLSLRLDATLSNDQLLTALGGTWFYTGGEVLLTVG